MSPRHLIRRGATAELVAPDGYARSAAVDEDSGAVHTGFGVCALRPGAAVAAHLHAMRRACSSWTVSWCSRPPRAPSCCAPATTVLVYSGISVKMMVDSDLGAHLQTMFMVRYEPGGVAGTHDHPLEETYLILEGEVEATFDGQPYRLAPGDIAWAGVGCVHGFANPTGAPVRWLETQAPQPPSRHSYRFTRDWQYLDARLAQD